MMSEENKARVRRMYDEVVGQRKIEVLDELLGDDFVEHETMPGIPPGREGVKALIGMFLSAFPDMQFELGDIVADGDVVASRMTMTGTHQGEFMGIPATGRSINVNSMEFLRVANGRVVEHWGVTDQAAMMQQLGVGPE